MGVKSGRCAFILSSASLGMLKAFRVGLAVMAAALAALMISVGHPTDLSWWGLSIFVFGFVLSPILVAYATVSRTHQRELKWTMALFSIGYCSFAALTFWSVFAEPDPTSGFAFLAVPAMGWLGLPPATILVDRT